LDEKLVADLETETAKLEETKSINDPETEREYETTYNYI
jgi:hypothetical protein